MLMKSYIFPDTEMVTVSPSMSEAEGEVYTYAVSSTLLIVTSGGVDANAGGLLAAWRFAINSSLM